MALRFDAVGAIDRTPKSKQWPSSIARIATLLERRRRVPRSASTRSPECGYIAMCECCIVCMRGGVAIGMDSR